MGEDHAAAAVTLESAVVERIPTETVVSAGASKNVTCALASTDGLSGRYN